MSNPKWLYGNSWERFPVAEGEIWSVDAVSHVAVHNLFAPMPGFMRESDLLFVDAPWNQGNVNSFYTKAGRSDYIDDYGDFMDALFHRVHEIDSRACYLEIGKQFVDEFERRLGRIYPCVQRWPVTYYRNHPCFIVRGGHAATPHDYEGRDEADVIKAVARDEQYRRIGDFCMGRGLVGLAAYAAGKPFAGTEINPRRLACLLDALAKQGAVVVRE